MKIKNNKIKLEVRPIYKIGKGHNDHISGSGKHDNRPRKMRTRSSTNSFYINDY